MLAESNCIGKPEGNKYNLIVIKNKKPRNSTYARSYSNS